MNFLWPQLLLSLLLIPLLIGIYIWALRRRRRYAVRFSTLSIIREAMPRRSSWRQHLPFALFMLAMAMLTTALARPAAEMKVPLNRTSIILALDISRSMCATDVAPNRLTVAQDAVLAFIEDQADGTQIGLVAFAGFAEIIVPPTNDKEQLREAVGNFTTSLGTAIGSATLKSIDAIANVNEAVASSGVNLSLGLDESEPVAGFYQPDIIVLLTDGANSTGPQPIDAARQAADRQVRVYTIGFGTDELPEMVCSPEQLGGDSFDRGFGSGIGRGSGSGFGAGGGGGRDFRRFIVIDEETLQAVADTTGGAYFRAQNADQLHEIFLDLPTQIVLQEQTLEITVIFVALGILFASFAAGLSLKWHRLP